MYLTTPHEDLFQSDAQLGTGEVIQIEPILGDDFYMVNRLLIGTEPPYLPKLACPPLTAYRRECRL